MIKTVELAAYLNDFLEFGAFGRDASNNGLQVEAGSELSRVVTGVDACMELFERAAEKRVDLVIVHHGISWGGEPRRFVGVVGKRLEFLFRNRISLYAAHLPLDAHPVIGNNALLANILKLENREMFCYYDGVRIGVKGTLTIPRTVVELAGIYECALQCRAGLYGDTGRTVRRVGCISGGAGHTGLDAAISDGVELLVTGEMEHELYHQAREAGIIVLALGHYCSEKGGVTALGEMVAGKFSLDVEFIDIPTGL